MAQVEEKVYLDEDGLTNVLEKEHGYFSSNKRVDMRKKNIYGYGFHIGNINSQSVSEAWTPPSKLTSNTTRDAYRAHAVIDGNKLYLCNIYNYRSSDNHVYYYVRAFDAETKRISTVGYYDRNFSDAKSSTVYAEIVDNVYDDINKCIYTLVSIDYTNTSNSGVSIYDCYCYDIVNQTLHYIPIETRIGGYDMLASMYTIGGNAYIVYHVCSGYSYWLNCKKINRNSFKALNVPSELNGFQMTNSCMSYLPVIYNDCLYIKDVSVYSPSTGFTKLGKTIKIHDEVVETVQNSTVPSEVDDLNDFYKSFGNGINYIHNTSDKKNLFATSLGGSTLFITIDGAIYDYATVSMAYSDTSAPSGGSKMYFDLDNERAFLFIYDHDAYGNSRGYVFVINNVYMD